MSIQLSPARRGSVILFLLLFFIGASAQTGTIKGTVKDASGNPLSGASITIQGRTRGTSTIADGSFSLLVPAGTFVVNASYVGFSTAKKTVTVTNDATVTVDFVLEERGQEQAVVVLGSRSLP